MTLAGGATTGFEIGRVLSRSFAVLRRRWPVLLLLIALFNWTPQILYPFIHAPVFRPGSHDGSSFLAFGASTVVFLIVSGVLEFAIIQVSLTADDRPASIPGAIAAALRGLLILAPIYLLRNTSAVINLAVYWLAGSPVSAATITTLAGLPLFLVSLAVAATWGVAPSVVLAERGGLVSSLRRTFELMSRGRAKYAGLYILSRIAIGAVTVLRTIAMLWLFRLGLARTGDSIVLSVGFGFAASLIFAFWAVVVASAYLEFIRVHDGVAQGDIASVFA